ncbi:MAG: pyrroline-5-carboxylate reductase [Leptospirales bacterium]
MEKTEQKKVVVIGLGNMGGAIAKALAASNYLVTGYDVREVKITKKIIIAATLEEAFIERVPVILAVKPHYIAEMTAKIPDGRLIVSVAAGVPVHTIDGHRKVPGSTIRVMPNTPALVKQGITALYANEITSKVEKEFCLEIFSAVGEAFYIENEDWMHAITAISGSGPAFVELFMQTMEDGGVSLGLPRDVARKLVIQTVIGTGELVKKSKKAPQELIHDVTSPGGTTIAGLQTLKDYSVERGILRAIRRAARRSRQLGG